MSLILRRPYRMPKQSPDAMASSFSPFLELPAELRDVILKLAATEDGDAVEINANTKLPAWASSCDQIRREGLPSWLLSNSFSICIRSEDDIKSIIAFEKLCVRYVSTDKMQVKITFAAKDEMPTLYRQPPPEEITEWVLHFICGGIWRPSRDDCHHTVPAVITSFLELGHRTREAGVQMGATVAMVDLMSWAISKTCTYARQSNQ